MKRRDFLKVLGVTATTPVLGQVVVPTPVEPVAPVEVPKVEAMPSRFLDKRIHFKNIGTFGLNDSFSMTERRGIMQYQSLAEKESVALPADRGANMDVRIYATPKEVALFEHHFNKFNKLEIDFEMQGLLVSAKDVVISSMSIVQEMDAPLALDLTLEILSEKVTMKEV